MSVDPQRYDTTGGFVVEVHPPRRHALDRYCDWCGAIGHTHTDDNPCPDYEDDPRQVAADVALAEGYGRRRS